MLRTYRTYNLAIGFLKYKFNNKLLGSATLIRVRTKFSYNLRLQPYSISLALLHILKI